MVNFFYDLNRDFVEVPPKEFYRAIFRVGELDKKDLFTKGKYIGIACEFTKGVKSNGKELVKRYSITDDLDEIDELLKSNNFIIISPISYVGKSRSTKNARIMYALAVEIDGLRVYESGRNIGYDELIHQFNKGFIPKPTYIVASGNGLHLYYLFEKPLVLFDNVKKSLMNYKRALTNLLWNKYTTDFWQEEKIQYESAFQGFRMAGGVTKKGERTRVFKAFDVVDIDYLNSFIGTVEDKIQIAYKSNLTLKEAEKKYPSWYQDRIIDKKVRGFWVVKRDLYDWWYRKIIDNFKVGHRYYCIMLLCVYAIKCNIPYDELVEDCFSLLDLFDSESTEETNRFTEKDISDALQAFEDKSLVTFPISIISKRSGIFIEKNKRNGRKQAEHIKIMNAIRDIVIPNGEWRNKEGRPKESGTKKDIVQEWRKNNPDGRKIDCERETGLSRHTVLKWWNYEND